METNFVFLVFFSFVFFLSLPLYEYLDDFVCYDCACAKNSGENLRNWYRRGKTGIARGQNRGCEELREKPREFLLGLGESNSVPTQIINRVKLSQKGISHNPKGSNGGRDIHPSETRDTSPTRVQNVFASL